MADNLMIGRRTFVKGGLAASALAALAACKNTPGGGNASGKSGGTMKFYINEPVAIDPYNLQESEGTQVGMTLFDSLTVFDWTKKELVGKAAESWEVNDDATEFTFHLVKGAKFHNGDKVDAQSFKRGWERILNPKMTTPSEIAYHLDPVVGAAEMKAGTATELTGVTCPDENTLVVKLSYATADFPYITTHPGLAPVPQAALDDPAAFLLAPIGNGPFKMDGKWESGQYINVKRFDDYYGEKAKLDGVNFSIQKDPKTAFTEFTAGNMDFCQVPAGRIKETEGQYGKSDDGYSVTSGKQVVTGVNASLYYLMMNLEDKTMADVNVRRAISLAINRQNIVDTLYEGSRVPADGLFPSLIDDDSANKWAYAKYDFDAAKKIVDDNNLAGTKVTLSYNTGGGHEDIMTIIQGDLEKIGFVVDQSGMEWATYLNKMTSGELQTGRLGWNADYPTMDNFIYPNFFSTAENNYSKFKDPEIDAAILAARKETDETKRRQAYREINKKIGDLAVIVPIMFYSNNHVGSSKLAKFYFGPTQKGNFAQAEMQA
ncbi:MAG: ABC transporter substrate-binding protein [Atopobium sp.]|uniref:peptide ABC transporter substrate-binding protein n=1 Tax=Atopobium sp. TaxID=1872650 RepID=UPI002A811C43|nr:ABC transporter substrate-binding protein [Atopobium sp.]MDY4523277.1 ABC transporter substrate-binding protein [Atopobium sp.]